MIIFMYLTKYMISSIITQKPCENMMFPSVMSQIIRISSEILYMIKHEK